MNPVILVKLKYSLEFFGFCLERVSIIPGISLPTFFPSPFTYSMPRFVVVLRCYVCVYTYTHYTPNFILILIIILMLSWSWYLEVNFKSFNVQAKKKLWHGITWYSKFKFAEREEKNTHTLNPKRVYLRLGNDHLICDNSVDTLHFLFFSTLLICVPFFSLLLFRQSRGQFDILQYVRLVS